MGRLSAGDRVPPRRIANLGGASLPLPDPERVVHLQFRRFAGCPVCDLHLRSFVARHPTLVAAAVREVVVFHSPEPELRKYQADLPFDVIADPDKTLYREFGVEAGPRALLDPRAWGPIAIAVASSIAGVLQRGRPLPPTDPAGGRLGLPADFLIASDGRLLACRYGAHAYDQWSVDDVLDLVGARGPLFPAGQGS